MYDPTGNGRLKCLITVTEQYFKIAMLGFCIAGFAACDGNSINSSAAEQNSTSPTLNNDQAVALSKVALSTFPQLPIDINQQTALYANAGQTELALTSNADLQLQSFDPSADNAGQPFTLEDDSPWTTDSDLQLLTTAAPVAPTIQNCSTSGLVNIQREPTQLRDNDTNSAIETAISLEFIDCTNGNHTDLVTQGGAFAITTSLEVDKETSDASADLLANFDDYSNTRISDTVTSTYWVDGEFGITALSNAEKTHSTTMFAAHGTINNPDASPLSSIKYDGFSLVFELTDQQQLTYIAGSIDATKGGERFNYTLSTIEPMGTVNGIVQGSFLLESGGSKLFIDRINTEEVTLSADYDDDGSIDYSTVIALPLENFTTAQNLFSLPY